MKTEQPIERVCGKCDYFNLFYSIDQYSGACYFYLTETNAHAKACNEFVPYQYEVQQP